MGCLPTIASGRFAILQMKPIQVLGYRPLQEVLEGLNQKQGKARQISQWQGPSSRNAQRVKHV
jgi:hypothetical protein